VFPTNDAGCITFQGAGKLCGGASDRKIRNFSVSCGTSTSVGQCKINCEMYTTVQCFNASDAAACLLNATSANDCAALKACKWKL
jgi:hypothetical protein